MWPESANGTQIRALVLTTTHALQSTQLDGHNVSQLRYHKIKVPIFEIYAPNPCFWIASAPFVRKSKIFMIVVCLVKFHKIHICHFMIV